MKIKYCLTMVAVITLAACQKADNVAPDASKVTISITNPAAGQTFYRGDTVFFTAAVQYASELHGYELTITDTATNALLLDLDEHVHDDHFSINTYWVDTLSQAKSLKINLDVEIDHDGHEANKTVFINSQP